MPQQDKQLILFLCMTMTSIPVYAQGADFSKIYQSAANGNPASEERVCTAYYKGTFVKKDLSQAATWCMKAAQQDLPVAQFNLGHMYEFGEGLPQSYANALLWYQKAAVNGFPDAQMHLGYMYQSGTGVPEDFSIAVKWYQMEIKQSNPKEWANIGMLYFDGDKHLPRDYQQAFHFFRMSADRGIAVSQYFLGLMYLNGLGVAKDPVTAVQWYQKSAEHGYYKAELDLGNLYYRGVGINKDLLKAYAWISLAIAQKKFTPDILKRAQSILQEIKASLSPEQLKQALELTNSYALQFKPDTQQ